MSLVYQKHLGSQEKVEKVNPTLLENKQDILRNCDSCARTSNIEVAHGL